MAPPSNSGEVWNHWYDVVDDDSLRQGDIFTKLIVPLLPDNLEPLSPDIVQSDSPLDIQWKDGDWIVFSASCDLDVARNVPFALLGRVLPMEDALGSGNARNQRQKAELIRRGLMPSKFRLAEHLEMTPAFPDSVVDYRVHVTMPVLFLRRACKGPRLRLKSPFREQFGNWVGSNISRVGIDDHMQIERDNAGVSDARLLEMVQSEEGTPHTE